MVEDKKSCAECQTPLEVGEEGVGYAYKILQWYCPICKAGCGELTKEEMIQYKGDSVE